MDGHAGRIGRGGRGGNPQSAPAEWAGLGRWRRLDCAQ
jgi:hypothetical protein